MAHISKKLKLDEGVSTHLPPLFHHRNTGGISLKSENLENQAKTNKTGQSEDVTNMEQSTTSTVFIVPEGIQSKRFQLLRSFAIKNGFQCQKDITNGVTHIISELTDIDQLARLYPKMSECFDLKIVSVEWLHSCVRQKALVPEEGFFIPGFHQWSETSKKISHSSSSNFTTGDSANNADGSLKCQSKFSKEVFNENVLERNATLNHNNQKLVEPLLFMVDYWTVMGDEKRSLAYSKAAATMKCLPFTVSSMNELDDLKGLGTGHCMKVIQEMLETGSCQEVTVKKESEKFQILKNLSTVYGIGPSLALRLHSSHDVNSVEDLQLNWCKLHLADERIKIGVAYHADLNTPVTRDTADKIMDIVKTELSHIKEDFCMELAGGFRRGKKSGHDVDILISCNRDGEEIGLLSKVMRQLNHKGYILHSRFEKSSYDEEAVFRKNYSQMSTMDHFEKCFCIFRCPLEGSLIADNGESPLKLDFQNLVSESRSKRDWRAIRVDLVIIPKSQWPYALLGWTGSKLYMRMLRHYSNTVLQRSLNSHGLWDRKDQRLLTAGSEEEVFEHLGLSYKDPSQRNF